jgi:hypothetical protein
VYRLLNLETGTVHKSHHVRFVESPTAPLLGDADAIASDSECGLWWDDEEEYPAARHTPGGDLDPGVTPGGDVGGEATPAPNNDMPMGVADPGMLEPTNNINNGGDGAEEGEVDGAVGLDDNDGLLGQVGRDPDLAKYYDPSKNSGFIHQPPANPKRVPKPTICTATIPPKALFSRTPVDIQDAVEPASVKEALSGPHAAHWLDAMNDEWESLHESGCSSLPISC